MAGKGFYLQKLSGQKIKVTKLRKNLTGSLPGAFLRQKYLAKKPVESILCFQPLFFLVLFLNFTNPVHKTNKNLSPPFLLVKDDFLKVF